jgi:hypothetical protein
MSCRTCCCKTFVLVLLAMAILAVPAFAQGNCLQDEYNLVQKQKLNCTANDVRVAQVSNVRDLSGNTLTTCIEGTTFSFVADFNIVTTANATNAGGRDNIGLYFQTDDTKPNALFGTCVDNIIAPLHTCSGTTGSIQCGTSGYQEFDASPDNCGDTSSSVNGNIIDTIVVTNFLCEAPAGSSTLVLPNCTSWQVPGSSNLCVSSSPSFPYPAPPAATPGSPSKCNCAVIPLPITPVTPSVIVQKACTTAQTAGPATFTQNPNTQSPTSCNVGNGTTTEGGTVTYTVAITNTTGTSGITIDQICDSAYGNVFTAAGFTGTACAAGSQCPAGSLAGSYCGNPGTTCGALDIPATGTTTATCTFTADQTKELTTVTNTVKVAGHADLNTSRTFGPSTSNSVSVTSTEVPSTATVTKSVIGTEAGCATVRYQVAVKNTSSLDESETLSALSDSAYGDLTKCTNTNCANNSGANGTLQILGTTCGQPAAGGLGTLSGSPGAGALGTIATGVTYTCQFDGQFCSALDNNSCISNADTASATLKGDEASDVAFTQGGNTITVKECFQATVTSTGP